MNKYESMNLSQLDDEVCAGTTNNSVEDLRDLAVVALRRLADAIEKRTPSTIHQPDDARIELALARRRIRFVDSLYFGERHPPIEFSPGGTKEEWQRFLAEGDPYIPPPPTPTPLVAKTFHTSMPF